MAESRSVSTPLAILIRKVFPLLLAALVGGSALSGCTGDSPSGNPTKTPPVATTTSEVTPVPASGTLRVWATPFASRPDPLRDPDRTHQAVYRLVYEGLFSLSENQSAVPALCGEWDLSGNGFYLTVHLSESARFHDGSRPDAADVKASFDAVKAAADSPHHMLLGNVENAIILDDTTIRFSYSVPDRFALHCLTFPIVPAESAVPATDVGEVPPGTGPYRMSWIDGGPDVSLDRVGTAASEPAGMIRSVRVVTLPDIRSAVEALEDDRVDLVDLNADEFLLYSKRQDLAVYHYSGSGYLFFSINAEVGRLLSDPDRFWFVRARMDDVRQMAGKELGQLTSAAIPAVPLSQVLAGRDSVALTQGTSHPLPDGDSRFPEQPLTILYPAEDPVRAEIADRTEAVLLEEGIQVTKLAASDPVFLSRLATQSYDIAICEATTIGIPDPGWLYLRDGLRTLPGMESLPVVPPGLDEYGNAMQNLRSLLSSFSSEREWVDLQEALVTCAQSAPVVGIGFVRQGLMAGHRVKGQFSSLRDNPYHGIEEVWVWSGS